ncbi:NrfD/PsrC family molybdoenzyme membrane anchor subunit [Desulfuribacillus stibiiarsenatis]|uniref:NrfD/PsrC family molybdoenzyme membrane anchor subunit n=1 Tax=Desulfuribacillus stibiiarsenatis TaxID=1390249 RepID=UPI0009F3A4F0|nr:NrfD/PsrC family molybdoenzyme membrane anchor subunit [Desulfuribacillus stibiiarsenatis]
MKRLYFLLIGLFSLVGLWAIYYRLTEGLTMTALTSNVSWGLWVVFYIFFIGLSAGSFLLSTMVYVFGMKQFEKIGKLALVSAFFALLGGLLFVFIDLGHPERFWHALAYRQLGSILSWEIHFYLLYMAIIVAELWYLLREDAARLVATTSGVKQTFLKAVTLGYKIPNSQQKLAADRAKSHKWMKILGVVGIPTAIGVHAGTGSLFAVVMAKHVWNTALTPIIFLVSALVSGAALMMILYAFLVDKNRQDKSMLQSLESLLILFIAVDLLLVAAEYVVGLYNYVPDERGILLDMLFGERWYIFWLGQITLGAIIPIALLSKSNKSSKVYGLAGISTILGILCVRWNLVVPAYLKPQLYGLDEAYVNSRLLYEYTPNMMEWVVSFGLISIVVLLFSWALNLLPIMENKEVEHSYEQTAERVHAI